LKNSNKSERILANVRWFAWVNTRNCRLFVTNQQSTKTPDYTFSNNFRQRPNGRELFISNVLRMGAGPNMRTRPSSRPSIEFCS